MKVDVYTTEALCLKRFFSYLGTLLIMGLLLKGCAIFTAEKEEERLPQGRFEEQCDVKGYRALTFEDGEFREERQRPHLDHPVYHGRGTYSLENDTLTLNYESWPEGHDVLINHQAPDTSLKERQIKIKFRDMQSKKPLPAVEVFLEDLNGNMIERYHSTDEGILEIGSKLPEDQNIQLRTDYVFYPEARFKLKEGDYQEIEIFLRAGAEDQRVEGSENYRVEVEDEETLHLHYPDRDEVCLFEKRDAEEGIDWENFDPREMR